MLNKCERCKKELVAGRCVNTKCPNNEMGNMMAAGRKQSIVKNPKYRQAFLREVAIPQARAAYGPEDKRVKDLQAELAREVRYHG